MERPYEVGQRAPGDWDAITNQRTIAVHEAENPGISDRGVYLCRKLLRDLVRGNAGPDMARGMDGAGQTLQTFASDTTIQAARLQDNTADRKLMKDIGKKVFDIISDADACDTADRRNYILGRLDELDGPVRDAAQ